MPVEALFGGDVVDVFFDQPLMEGPLEPANWSVHYGGVSYVVIEAAAADDAVQLAIGQPGFGPGEDGVCYAASPADVIGINGRPAEAFSDFPFT